MAMAMSASGERNPKATRVMRRILVLTDSMRPLDRPCSIAARIEARWFVMDLANFTNAGMRQRRAHDSHRSSASVACFSGSLKTVRSPSLSR